MGFVIMVVMIMMIIGMIPVIMIIVVMLIVVMLISMIMMVVIMFVMIIVRAMIMLVMALLVMVVIDVDLAVKVFRLTPDKRRSDSSLDRQTGAVAKPPLENATEHPIDGVMLGIPFEVGIKTTMALKGDHWGEIKFTSF